MKLFSVNSMFLIFHCPEETSKTRRAATTNITTHHPPTPSSASLLYESDCSWALLWWLEVWFFVPAVSSVPSPFCIICWLVKSGLNTENHKPVQRPGINPSIGQHIIHKKKKLATTYCTILGTGWPNVEYYIYPYYVWVVDPHLKMSSEVYKWCSGLTQCWR